MKLLGFAILHKTETTSVIFFFFSLEAQHVHLPPPLVKFPQWSSSLLFIRSLKQHPAQGQFQPLSMFTHMLTDNYTDNESYVSYHDYVAWTDTVTITAPGIQYQYPTVPFFGILLDLSWQKCHFCCKKKSKPYLPFPFTPISTACSLSDSHPGI